MSQQAKLSPEADGQEELEMSPESPEKRPFAGHLAPSPKHNQYVPNNVLKLGAINNVRFPLVRMSIRTI